MFGEGEGRTNKKKERNKKGKNEKKIGIIKE